MAAFRGLIGSLGINLDANIARFESDMGRAEKLSRKRMRAIQKNAKTMGKAIGLAFTAAGTAAAASIRQTTQEADRLQKLTGVLSLTVEEIQELRFAAEQAAGVTNKTFDLAMQRFSRRVGESANDTGELNAVVKEMGVQLRNADGTLKSQTELLGIFAERIKNAESEQEALRIAFKLFDSEGAKMVTLLREGSAGIEELRDQARATGSIISDETAVAAERLSDAMNILQKNAGGLSTQFASGAIPILSATAETLSEVSMQGDAVAKRTTRMAQAGQDFASNFINVVELAARGAAGFVHLGRAIGAVAATIQETTNLLPSLGGGLEQFATLFEGIKGLDAGKINKALYGDERGISAWFDEEAAEETEEKMRSTASRIAEIWRAFGEDSLDTEGGIDAFFATLRENIENFDVSDIEMPDLSLPELGKSNEEMKESEKRIKKIQQLYASLTRELRPARAAQDEFAASMQMVREALASGDVGIGRAIQLYRLLQEQYLSVIQTVAENSLESELSDEVMSVLENIESWDVDPVTQQIELLEDALRDATDPEITARLESALERLRMESEGVGIAMQRGAYMAADGFRSLQSMTKEGSDAYKAMQVAIDAANLIAAIGVVINQGFGDPYTAFARMAAMAAAVASLGYSVGGSLGGAGRAEQRQEQQGTGSVLGDAAAKSESIANAIEITADATSELVGINRGMLRALQNLQAGISGASGMLARGASQFEVDMTGMGSSDFVEAIQIAFDPLAALFGISVGGKADIVDSGIQILGGTIDELINDTLIRAYQEVAEKKHFLDDTDYKVYTDALDEELLSQFQLIFESISDTVVEAAKALGLDEDAIADAVAGFQISEMMISLEGLDADEQQAELEAVFGEIFDGLVRSVIPFIGQFQRVGEGLGETLVRVATSVQVMEEAVTQLGLSVDQSDPESFAQISVGLIEMAGGIEEFIGQMQSFVDNFATDSHKFSIAQDELNRAFEQVGLSVPETSEGMWELMQSLDASTEEGQRQISTLLELSDTAAQYYDLLEEREKARLELISRLQGEEQQLIALIERRAEAAQSALDEAGFGGLDATEMTRESLNAFLAELGEMPTGLAEAVEAILDMIDAEEELENMREQNSRELVDILIDTVGTTPFRRDMIDLRRRFDDAMEAAEQLGASQRELELIQSAFSREVDRMVARLRARIQDLASQLFDGSQGVSDTIVAGAQVAAGSLNDTAENLFESWERAIKSLRDYVQDLLLDEDLTTLTPSEQLSEAQAQFDELLAAAMAGDLDAAEELPQAAQDLLDIARDFFASSQDYQDIFDAVIAGLNQVDIPDDVSPGSGGVGGVGGTTEPTDTQSDFDRLVLATELAEALNDLAFVLDESVIALADELGVPLEELVSTLGVSLDNMTTEMVQELADVATLLGTDLTELSDSLGIEIGNIADATSLLNDAFESEVEALPPDIQAQLDPLLDDIEDATTEADANAAIDALKEEVQNNLPAGMAEALGPYLGLDFPDDIASQTAFLDSIDSELADIRGDTLTIAEKIDAIAQDAGLAVGSSYVQSDGFRMLHQGEIVLPAAVSDWVRSNGLVAAMPVNVPTDVRSENDDSDIRGELASIRREIRNGSVSIVDSIGDQTGKLSRNRDVTRHRSQGCG